MPWRETRQGALRGMIDSTGWKEPGPVTAHVIWGQGNYLVLALALAFGASVWGARPGRFVKMSHQHNDDGPPHRRAAFNITETTRRVHICTN